MQTINHTVTYTLEVKKSKFITYLFPYEEFDTKLSQLKNEHPKARHFVIAYRYLNEYNQIVEGSSDDGEPKGSSGRPTLKVLQGHDLINIGVITVRYFGGTLLGVGGLVRAYSDSLNLAIASSKLQMYEDRLIEIVEVNYTQASRCEYLFKKYNIKVLQRDFLDGIRYKIESNKENLEYLRKEIGE